MTSPSHVHTHARVLPRNTYNHTYIRFFLDKTKQSHTQSRQITCIMFTPDPAEYKSNLDLKINNTSLPMATHPKVHISGGDCGWYVCDVLYAVWYGRVTVSCFVVHGCGVSRRYINCDVFSVVDVYFGTRHKQPTSA